MRKICLLFVSIMFALSVTAQQHPLWMRYSSISPDGTTIAFSYKGDIFTIPVQGGNARQLTSNAAYESYPIWNPDGERIAFVSTREGSYDIYVMSKNGGEPKRLTTDSGNEIPMTWRDNEHILFETTGMPTAKSIYFASSQFPQVYETDVKGSRPRLVSAVTMESMSINKNGDILYHDKKGYEDELRKHHRSPITRDIWLNKNGKFTKLTAFNGEDRNPVWAADGQSFYYLSEEDGTFNVYRRNVESANKTQLTRFKDNPVRYLTAAENGTL